MIIQKAEFITSLDAYRELTDPPLPEIAAAGRSNVGKSTMLNKLANRHNLARVSGTPGKTRLLNVYRLNDAIHWIDLPGYGFAQASKTEQARWSQRTDSYFSATRSLRLVMHLVDSRHEPTRDDLTMNAFLRKTGLPFVTVATKSDKFSRAQQTKQLHMLARELQVQPWDIILFSGVDGTGIDAVRATVGKATEPAAD